MHRTAHASPTSARRTDLQYFSPCPRGLERILAAELDFFGAGDVAPTEGGVAFVGDQALGYAVNLRSRVASRVLLAVGQANYRDEEDLYRLAVDIPWEQWNGPEESLRIDVVGQQAQLTSLNFATLRIKDAMCDRYRQRCQGMRPVIDVRSPARRVFAFVDAWQVTLYRDLTGEPLFKRGWRLEKGEAPLRENMAAGLLALAGWTRDQPLVDPMCGSGTYIIEAALIAAGCAPGAGRHFSFQLADDFDERVWNQLKEAVPTPNLKRVPPMIANDLAPEMVEIVQRNLERAGLGSLIGNAIRIKQGDALQVKAPSAHGVLVTNPPYGQRLERAKVKKISGPAGRAPRPNPNAQPLPEADPEELEFLLQLGSHLKHHYNGWKAWILTNDMNLPGKLQLKAAKRTPVFNGAIECRWFGFDLISGSMRRTKPGDPGHRR